MADIGDSKGDKNMSSGKLVSRRLKIVIGLGVSLFLVLPMIGFTVGCAKKEEKAPQGVKKEVEGKEEKVSDEEGKKAVLIVAHRDFRDEEYKEPREVLEEAGVGVTVACSQPGVAQGKLGMTVKPDITIDQIDVDEFDIIVFVGGPGSAEYFDDSIAHQIARDAVEKDKVLGAICIAPATLANAGVLKGKRATVFSSEVSALEAGGAIYTAKSVEKDGKIVTANGPAAANEFGEALLEVAQ